MSNESLYILDLDNCLIYSSFQELKGQSLVSKRKYHFLYHRPFLKEFLKYITQHNDIVFYTSSKVDYARWVVSSFGLEKEPVIFSRKYTKRKQNQFGETYYKSIDFIHLNKTYTSIKILDDRSDFWLDSDVIYLEISPWMGDFQDRELEKMISQ